ncbi:uncharacterized protein LOC129753056 [Uranotaenia lowii]|uniref:uncharacterized protein LOC129753056 n=1 Tax=Uranotaenia lowii TaxID=190385 RepID=UPI002479DC9E|nr:uncharacterized protein LOC129753056 [Uranotaenia lowii]
MNVLVLFLITVQIFCTAADDKCEEVQMQLDNNCPNYEATNETATVLSRKKRFLLFPVSASVLVTASMLKSLLFKGPGGNVALLELDLYHPLPDYRYRFSTLRLGEIAMLPDMTSTPAPNMTKPPPPPTTTSAPAPPMMPEMHHSGQELTPMELEQYLKAHPDAYVPPGYSKDRSDWIRPAQQYSSNMYYQPNRYDYYRQPVRQMYDAQPIRSKLWHLDPADYFGQNYRIKRSTNGMHEIDYELHKDKDRFNISHHRDWELYYHYRERRELYHTLTSEFEEKFHFPMRSCLMRAICEGRKFLGPSGKSMIKDIIRILLTIPLKDDLEDDYSGAMRNESLDCHGLYGKECPISILYLLLFGKFVP